MATNINVGESAAAVAYALTQDVLLATNRAVVNSAGTNSRDKSIVTEVELLDLYARCYAAASGHRVIAK